MQEQIQKALFRLQEGDGGTAEAPLFSSKSATAPPRLRLAPSTDTRANTAQSEAQAPPPAAQEQPEELENDEAFAAAEADEQTMDTFTFGAAADEAAESPFGGEQMDEGDNVDDGELDEREDYLRRAAAKRQSRNAVSAALMDLAMARSMRLNKVERIPTLSIDW